MSLGIAALAAFGTCLFFTAAVLAWLVDRLAGGRTRLWAHATLAFGLLAIERATNALEWAASERFAGFDTFQGYMSALVSVILAAVVFRFWYLFRQFSQEDAGGH